MTFYSGKSTWGTLNKRSESTTYEVKHLLENEIDEQTVPFEKELRRIYKACLDVDQINEKGAQPAKDFINEKFGGWSWNLNDGQEIKFQVGTEQFS